MGIKQLECAMEAILFASGDPVPCERFCQVLNIDQEMAELLIGRLRDRLDDRDSALEVIKVGDSYQLTTRPEFADQIRSALEIRRNTPLSQAAFEVLAVVAYHQPVTKSYMEQVRGVDCSGVVSSLVAKGLIEEQGRLDLPGRPLLYGTTENFLRCFGLSCLADLPPIPQDTPHQEEQPMINQLQDEAY